MKAKVQRHEGFEVLELRGSPPDDYIRLNWGERISIFEPTSDFLRELRDVCDAELKRRETTK